MKIAYIFIFIVIFKTHHCHEIKDIFEKINKESEEFNAAAAELNWESSINSGNPNFVQELAILQRNNVEWQHRLCDELERLQYRYSFNTSQLRQKYLLCRGPKYTYKEVRLITNLLNELQAIYSETKVCIPTDGKKSLTSLTDLENAIFKYLKSADDFIKQTYHLLDSTMFAVKNAISNEKGEDKGLCLRGEDEFEKLVVFSRNEKVLKWLWLVWREKVGPPMKEPYKKLVEVENVAARRNGYANIGASWRDELEIPNLQQTCRRLYEEVKPLYTLLHGVMRFYLRKKYGNVVPESGPIPAHLLGDLWAQNWEPLANLIIPTSVDLDENIKKLNWTVNHMVKRAEDFYLSLGLPPMTDAFWKKSVFLKENNVSRCHGTAADMFKEGDFRLLYCSRKTIEDFYVIHHELGHIQYYMAYKHLPALYRQANMAFHEAIGDTIMHGVMTPQHLHRLGLINDSLLYNTNILSRGGNNYHTTQSENENKNRIFVGTEHNKINIENLNEEEDSFENVNIKTDDILLLKQALNKIPQIPFSLLIDEYRWKYFKDDFTSLYLNEAFWEMALSLQGIAPAMKRGILEFDIGAKFHVPDNTPYIRYFLSSFLQNQLFESLCKAAVFGRRGVKDPLPGTITMNRCDVYGSKTAGKLLKDIMSRGHSQHWRQILKETTGQDHISAVPLLRYYRPLQAVLEKLVRLHRIPIGW